MCENNARKKQAAAFPKFSLPFARERERESERRRRQLIIVWGGRKYSALLLLLEKGLVPRVRAYVRECILHLTINRERAAAATGDQ
jgi:hypothetical protein